MATAVKICGITRVEDGLAAARAGAHAIGLVFYPKSPRCITPVRASEIIRSLPPFITTVGLFVNSTAEEVHSVLRRAPVELLQFQGEETPEFCRWFGRPYVKAVRVRPGMDLLQYACDYHDARALLLDAYVEGLHGGSGVAFDWSLIPRGLPLPVILSGGLTVENVTEAVRRVRPSAVDVSSGVESAKGVKDAARISAFIKGVRNADL
ncbi:MAG: phosphoribosylanthranilate isomerase [Betaproteobacteria bacterium]|nr:phosphoribosylanthranilate isomerase [Betaproteobacteria bacterium]MBI2510010.1 phosphoribosylanthranilate isomerase [Betaproteobacteria bacterium]